MKRLLLLERMSIPLAALNHAADKTLIAPILRADRYLPPATGASTR